MVEHCEEAGCDVLIFIENTPRAYAWGSSEDLPAILGTSPTGDPQAELWLGAHPDDPAEVAKATPTKQTLIDLIKEDPEAYGVHGGGLPFLLKVLAIGAPLSLQVHPNLAQAREGFAREEAAGVPRCAPERNYRDANHKPELLVALTEARAFAGFRPVADAVRDLARAAAASRRAGESADAAGLDAASDQLLDVPEEEARNRFIAWAFSGAPEVERALEGLKCWLRIAEAGEHEEHPDPDRVRSLGEVLDRYPTDPGALVTVLLNHVTLAPEEAIFLAAGQPHAYIHGVGVEIMASSDNVLRAGLTSKHIDVPELCRVLDPSTVEDPRVGRRAVKPGLVAWRPPVDDFELWRVRVSDPESSRPSRGGAAASVAVPARSPLVLIVTSGRARIARQSDELDEVASVRHGQSLYVSAGVPIEVTGDAEVFVASVPDEAI